MRNARALLLLTASLATAGAVLCFSCETGLPQSYVLSGPRILAIRSTPADLVPGGQVTLDALVYVPPGSPQPTYQWSWCGVVGATLQCSVTADQLAQLVETEEGGVTLDYSLGSSPTAVFGYPASPALIEAACQRHRADLVDAGFNDDGGIPTEDASVTTLVEGGAPGGLTCSGDTWTPYILLTVQVGQQTLQAVRSLTAYLDVPSDVNHNPTIDGLLPFTSGAPPADAGPLANPGDEADGAVVDAGVGTDDDAGLVLAAVVPESASEVYATRSLPDGGPDLGGSAPAVTPCEDGGEDATTPGLAEDAGDDASLAPLPPLTSCTVNAAQVHESLTLAWYVGGGVIDHPTTTLRASAAGAPQDWSSLLLDPWAPPSQAGAVPIILVLRDDRGGVGWYVQQATLPVGRGAP